MRNTSIKSFLLAVLVAALLGGCAAPGDYRDPRDPIEGFNRGVYKFNDAADNAVIKPIAGAYKVVVPGLIRTGVGNFFDNVGSVPTLINELLQFKFSNAADTAGRLVINTTVGIGGLIDVASMDNVPKHKNDFGLTLANWGWKNSSYFVLPLLGPSTFRDASGYVVDTKFFYPITYLDDVRTRNQLILLHFIDLRSQFLPGSDLLDEAALDSYSFMRDAFFQRRDNRIFDGNPPQQNLDDDVGSAPAK